MRVADGPVSEAAAGNGGVRSGGSPNPPAWRPECSGTDGLVYRWNDKAKMELLIRWQAAYFLIPTIIVSRGD